MALCSIENGNISTNELEYNRIRDSLRRAVTEGVTNTPFRYLPVDRQKFIDGLTDILLPEWSSGGARRADKICNAIAKGPKQIAEDLKKLIRGIGDGKFQQDKAEDAGFFAESVIPKYSCPDADTWEEGSYYYYDNPSCESIVSYAGDDSSGFYNVPATMYIAPIEPERVFKLIYDPDVQNRFSKGYVNDDLREIGIHQTPVQCVGPKGEKAWYRFDYMSDLWDLRYTLGYQGKKYQDYALDSWFLIPYCIHTDSKGEQHVLEETKLKFDFGIRPQIPVNVNIDDEKRTFTVVASAIAAVPDSSYVRDDFLASAPDKFFVGEMSKSIVFNEESQRTPSRRRL